MEGGCQPAIVWTLTAVSEQPADRAETRALRRVLDGLHQKIEASIGSTQPATVGMRRMPIE